MKKLSMWSIVMTLIVALLVPLSAGAQEPIEIVVDGKTVNLDTKPLKENNRVLVPLRGVFEEMGMTVHWEASPSTAYISGYKWNITLENDKKEVSVNGEVVNLDVPAKVKDGRMYIPLRFVSEAIGSNVHWDETTETVTIHTGLVKDLDQFLEEMQGADLNSFSSNIILQQMMNIDDMELEMTMDMKQDFVLDPLGIYQVTNMKIAETDLAEEQTTEAYITEDGFYQYDPLADVWIKFPDEFVSDLLELSTYEQTPFDQIELLNDFMKGLTVVDNGDTYTMHFYVDSEGFEALFADIAMIFEGELGDELGLDESLFERFHMEYVMEVEKETFYPISTDAVTDIVISEAGETMAIKQNLKATYDNFNGVDEIRIPQEVIDSAVPIEDLYEEISEESLS